jgi:hypothetical protein
MTGLPIAHVPTNRKKNELGDGPIVPSISSRWDWEARIENE